MTDMKKICRMIYGIFAASVLMAFVSQLTIFAMIIGIAGIILCYVNRKKAAGTIYESHIQWLIRTFWIGNALYFPVLFALAMLVSFMTMDLDPLRTLMMSTEQPTDVQLSAALFETNYDVLYRITIGMWAAFTALWLKRCWYGYSFLKKDAAVEKVTRWF